MFGKIFKKFISVLANITYILIAIYAIIAIPSFFGYKPLVVLSGSMEPTFKVGSVIYYEPLNGEEIKEKDIIVYKLDDKFVTHRVNRIENGVYYTKGDANNSEDSLPPTIDNIVGKVNKVHIILVGYYIKFINDHIYLAVVAVVILVLEFLLSLKKDTENTEKKVKEKKKMITAQNKKQKEEEPSGEEEVIVTEKEEKKDEK